MKKLSPFLTNLRSGPSKLAAALLRRGFKTGADSTIANPIVGKNLRTRVRKRERVIKRERERKRATFLPSTR